MDSRSKENRQLSHLFQTTDTRIHSKNGLFEQILKDQPLEVLQLKQDIIRFSYSIKSLGMQNGEIGILTKRMPLKTKQKPAIPNYPHTQKVNYNRNYITHSSFYSPPLHVIKKQQSSQRYDQPIGIDFNPQSIDRQSIDTRRSSRPRRPSRSMKNIRIKINTSQSKHLSVQTKRNTRSYSQLLREVNNKKIQKLEPLQGESNLFDRIKKISNLTKVQLASGKHAGKIAYLKNL